MYKKYVISIVIVHVHISVNCTSSEVYARYVCRSIGNEITFDFPAMIFEYKKIVLETTPFVSCNILKKKNNNIKIK